MFARISSALALLIVAGLIGCSTAPKTEAKKESLQDAAQATIKQFNAADAGMEAFLNKSYGKVVFPSAGKGGLIVGGAYGKGIVYQGDEMIGYADMKQATIGLQAGGQSFAQIIAFENQAALNRFKNNELAFSANVSAVIIKSGAAASAKYSDGVAVFVKPEGGAMAEASIGGQQFTYKAANKMHD